MTDGSSDALPEFAPLPGLLPDDKAADDKAADDKAAMADLDAHVRLAEAMIFAASAPIGPRALTQLLPDGVDVDAVLAAVQARYAGRGVELVEVGGGWQFRTAPDLAARLKRVVQVPRRLARVAMETLAIIAYHQPVTRGEIEEIRGASLAQSTLDALLEAELITPKGRRETPGRPTEWGTTAGFLTQFGLRSLRELPRREELLVEPQVAATIASQSSHKGEPTEIAPTSSRA